MANVSFDHALLVRMLGILPVLDPAEDCDFFFNSSYGPKVECLPFFFPERMSLEAPVKQSDVTLRVTNIPARQQPL